MPYAWAVCACSFRLLQLLAPYLLLNSNGWFSFARNQWRARTFQILMFTNVFLYYLLFLISS